MSVWFVTHTRIAWICVHEIFASLFSVGVQRLYKISSTLPGNCSVHSHSLSKCALSSRLVRGLYSMWKSIAMKESKHVQMSLSVAEYCLAWDLAHLSLYQHINSVSFSEVLCITTRTPHYTGTWVHFKEIFFKCSLSRPSQKFCSSSHFIIHS